MRNIGSTNNLKASSIALQGQRSFIGPTGPIGNTGPSVTGGYTGNTGSTGSGVLYITTNYPDGLTIYLNDGAVFDVSGVSGNTATQNESFLRATNNTRSPLTNTTSNFLFAGITLPTQATRISGFTLHYPNYYGVNGISLYYDGNDLVFRGLTGFSNIGPTGSVLGAFGNTAFGLIDASGVPVFKYTTTTMGITTEHVVSGVLNQFIQTKNTTGITNINVTDISGITSYVNNVNNVSSNFFYISGNTWTNKQYYNTTYSGVTTASGSTSGYVSHNIFNISNTVSFGKRKVGSCCYCDNSGKKTCLDYTAEDYCADYLGGSFSFSPCFQRRSADCDDWGACCLPGRCVNTTRALCSKFRGIFHDDRLCSAANACL